MTEQLNRRLLGPVMFWTVLTTLFTWLPLVRIIGRPEGYTWRIPGFAGEGIEGPFWVFLPLTAFSVLLLYTSERGPRKVFHLLLVLWNLVVLGVVVTALILGGFNANWQGQGLYWAIPMWVAAVLATSITVMAVVWVMMDRRHPASNLTGPWNRSNTLRLAMALMLLVIALILFRAGTNYNWVTAVAILATVMHWIILAWSFGATARNGDIQK